MFRSFGLSAALLILAPPLHAINPTLQARLTASDGGGGDWFGTSVSISGDTAVVGANYSNLSAGAAYVYVRNGSTWTQQAKLTGSDVGWSEWFGLAVAISSDTILVGAPYHPQSGTGPLRAGAVYVFTRSGNVWTQQQKLIASDTAQNNLFGRAVALEGDTAVIGTPYGDYPSFMGTVYVFVRSRGVWSLQAKLTASDRANSDYFGWSVALKGDTAAVGAMGKNAARGAIYMYTRSGATWSQQAKLLAADGAPSDSFGLSVSIDANTLVSGSYQKRTAYVFVRSGNTWTQQAELMASDTAPYDYFGYAVAVNGDTLAVSTRRLYSISPPGAVYLFTRNNGVWSQQDKLMPSDGGDFFGNALDLTLNSLVVGAPANDALGAAYVYSMTGTADTSPPLIASTMSPAPNSPGWNRTDVTVSWTVSDPESGIASSSGCDATYLTSNTAAQTIACSATNGAGLTTTRSVTVKLDKTSPVISSMPAIGCTLWPPNHKLVQVATVTASDALSGLVPGSFQVTGTSNEPIDPNDPAIVITPNGSGGFIVQLQADRLATGTGRIYTLMATANDFAGNTTAVTSTCTVPHDQGN